MRKPTQTAAHLDGRAVDVLARNMNMLPHPDGRPMRLVQLDGSTPQVLQVKKELAQAILHLLHTDGYELRRRKR